MCVSSHSHIPSAHKTLPLLYTAPKQGEQTNKHDPAAGEEFSNIELAKAQQNLEHYITD